MKRDRLSVAIHQEHDTARAFHTQTRDHILQPLKLLFLDDKGRLCHFLLISQLKLAWFGYRLKRERMERAGSRDKNRTLKVSTRNNYPSSLFSSADGAKSRLREGLNSAKFRTINAYITAE